MTVAGNLGINNEGVPSDYEGHVTGSASGNVRLCGAESWPGPAANRLNPPGDKLMLMYWATSRFLKVQK